MAAANEDKVPPGPADDDEDTYENKGPSREVHYVVGEPVEILDGSMWVRAVITKPKITRYSLKYKDIEIGYFVEYTDQTHKTREMIEVPYGMECLWMRKVRRQDLPVQAGAGPDIAARPNPYFIDAPR